MDDDKQLRMGDRVNTPFGLGTVNYVRYASHDYSKISAVSVTLDSLKNDPRHTGTILQADLVTKIVQ